MRLLFEKCRFLAVERIANLHGASAGYPAGNIPSHSPPFQKLLAAGANQDAKAGLCQFPSERFGGRWRVRVGFNVPDDRDDRVSHNKLLYLPSTENASSALPAMPPAKP